MTENGKKRLDKVAGWGCDRESLRAIARSKELVIDAGSINVDHMLMLIGRRPNLSASQTVHYSKCESSHWLLKE